MSYNIGNNEKSDNFSDPSTFLANKGYFLEVFHIPTQKSVQFKAFLTQFQDTYDPQWDESVVYGRADSMSIYKSTKRLLNLGFDIVAAGEGEARDNLQKISLLTSFLYPTYEYSKEFNASSISASPLLKLSFANLITNAAVNSQGTNASVGGLVGKIGGFSATPNLDVGVFSQDSTLYFKEYKVAFSYSVYHTHRVGYDKNTKEFSVANFPYGVPHFGVKTKSKGIERRIPQQRQAAANKIVK